MNLRRIRAGITSAWWTRTSRRVPFTMRSGSMRVTSHDGLPVLAPPPATRADISTAATFDRAASGVVALPHDRSPIAVERRRQHAAPDRAAHQRTAGQRVARYSPTGLLPGAQGLVESYRRERVRAAGFLGAGRHVDGGLCLHARTQPVRAGRGCAGFVAGRYQ